MRLSELLNGVEFHCWNFNDSDILDVGVDSRNITENSLFCAICGLKSDGNEYIDEAIKNGAIVIVSEKQAKCAVPLIKVQNVRIAMSQIASNFYHNPASKMRMIGVTGTNGKTTTAQIIKSIIAVTGSKVGIIGTLGAQWDDNNIDTCMTTPDSFLLQKILENMYKNNIRYVVMEVSAHAIHLNKVFGIVFDTMVFTNFSQDHLDYFITLENYKKAKLNIFTNTYCRSAISNSDDEVGQAIIKLRNIPVISYGIKYPADCFAINFSDADKHTFVINLFDEIYTISTTLKGVFNRYNILAAATACKIIGIDKVSIEKGINTMLEIPGRFNIIDREFRVVIDYAHTPDGLKNILIAARRNSGKLICVFGCGGNRDTTKRPLMGKVVNEYADVVIVTSDNPRLEDPDSIIDSIVSDINNYVRYADRTEAIIYALKIAERGDTVVIAGKGSEPYIDVGGKKLPYSDRNTVIKILGENR